MKLKVRLLLAGFIFSFLFVAVLSTISFLRTRNLSARVGLVEHSFLITTTINKINAHLEAIDRSVFRFMATQDSSFLEPFNRSIYHLQKTTDSLRIFTVDDKKQQGHIVTLQADQALYVTDCRELIKHAFSSIPSFLSSEAFLHNKKSLATLRATLNDMAGVEQHLLEARTEDRRSYMALTTTLIRLLSIIFSLLTTILFILLLREFRKRIRYQAELQQKLTEIAQSKRELEHIAYATSHDLQEPLRKIRILTDKWYGQNKESLSEENISILKRVSASATRMHELVSELMVLASLNDDARKVACKPEHYIDAAKEQLSSAIVQKNASIEFGSLPVLNAFPDQLQLLFKNLIDNSLKFSKPDVAPHIIITGRKANSTELSEYNISGIAYHCITIQDNGLGFDNRQVDKMFGIFRQLHTTQDGATGKGMGLAICQRIMNNHRGHIIAHGFPDEGATFKLYFPINGKDKER